MVIKYSNVVVYALFRLTSLINSAIVVIRVCNLLIKYTILFILSCIGSRFVCNTSIDGDDDGDGAFVGVWSYGNTCSCLHLWLLVKVVYTLVIFLTITSFPLLLLCEPSDISTVSPGEYL